MEVMDRTDSLESCMSVVTRYKCEVSQLSDWTEKQNYPQKHLQPFLWLHSWITGLLYHRTIASQGWNKHISINLLNLNSSSVHLDHFRLLNLAVYTPTPCKCQCLNHCEEDFFILNLYETTTDVLMKSHNQPVSSLVRSPPSPSTSRLMKTCRSSRANLDT